MGFSDNGRPRSLPLLFAPITPSLHYSNTPTRLRKERTVNLTRASMGWLVGWFFLLACGGLAPAAEEEPAAEPINAFARRVPMDTGVKAGVKIWFSKGVWHLAWGSKAKDSQGERILGHWHGRVVALDGTSIRRRTKRMDARPDEDTFQDRAESKETELRFTSTTGAGVDGIIFGTDATKLRFEIYESKKLVPRDSIFVGARAENPSKVPFVLKAPSAKGAKKRGR